MENGGLLNKQRVDSAEVDWSIVKIVVLAVVSAVSAVSSSFFLKFLIVDGETAVWPFFLASAVVFLSFSFLLVFFVKSPRRANFIFFLGSLALASAFYEWIFLAPLYVLASSGVVFLFFLWAGYSGRNELRNMIKIKFWRIGKIFLPKAVAGIAAFIGIVCYVNFQFFVFQGSEFFVSRDDFNKFAVPFFIPVVERILPEVGASFNVEKLIVELTKEQLVDKLNPGFFNFDADFLNEGIGNLVMEQLNKENLSGDIKKELKNKFSSLSNPAEISFKASDVLYQIMTERYLSVASSTKTAIVIGSAAFVFLSIVGLIFPLRLLIGFTAFIIYEIMIAVGFAEIILEGRSREIIILK